MSDLPGQRQPLTEPRRQAGLPVPSAPSRPTAGIKPLHVLILGSLSAFGPLSTDMYLPALPAISAELGATMSQTQLTLSAGILGLALGQLIVGPLSDTIGRRRPLLGGIAAFTLASLLCMVAPSVYALLLLRLVQGLAGAAGIALALAIASDLYAGVALARCLALLMLVSGVAPIVAPVIGSQLLTVTSWRGIFVVLAIFGAVLLGAAWLSLRETLPAERRQPGGVAVALRGFGALLRERRFVGYALTSGLAFAACIVYISVSPFILQAVYGLSPQRLGLVFGANALALVVMSQISGAIVGRFAPQTLLRWGVALLGAGALFLLVAVLGGLGLPGVLAALLAVVASMGFIAPNAATLALTNARAAGSAAAVLGVLQFSIGALAAPLVGLGGTETALPMAATIAAFGLATGGALLIVSRAAPVDTTVGQPDLAG